MNANQIHVGHEYAIAPYKKPNGNVFVPNAIRFVAYRTFGEQEWGNKKLTMYVEGFRLDEETGQPISTNYVRFRVRDVIDDWDEYQDRADQEAVEQEKRRAEQERYWREQEERRRREREEWERQRREREAREEELRKQREAERERQRVERINRANKLREQLADRGLDPVSVNIDFDTGKVEITLVELERWLASLTRVECETCHRELVMLPKGLF